MAPPPPPHAFPSQNEQQPLIAPVVIPAEVLATGIETKKVYVTGFGTFRRIQVNPSYLIASSLPPVLPSQYLRRDPPKNHKSPHHPHGPRNGNDDVNDSNKARDNDLRKHHYPDFKVALEVLPHPVEVTYDYVNELQRSIPDDADLTVHIGVAASYDHVTIETRARSAFYNGAGSDGKQLGNGGRATERKQCERDENGECVILHTAVDVNYTIKRCEKFRDTKGYEDLCNVDVSADAGLYLCEYIYYKSLERVLYGNDEGDELSNCRKDGDDGDDEKERRRKKQSSDKVLFIHVPDGTDEESIRKARTTIMMIIGSIMLAKFGEKGDDEEEEPKIEMKEEASVGDDGEGFVIVN